MKNYEIFIPCRVNSRRLPFKHFHTIGCFTVIETLVQNLTKITDARINIICPDSPENDIFEELEALYPIAVFRGDEQDVLNRFVTAIHERKDAAKYAVRVNGDGVLPNPEVFAKLDAQIMNNGHDIYTTVGTNVPSGQHVEAVRIEWLLSQVDTLKQAKPHDREHVFPILYSMTQSVHKLDISETVAVNLSIDTFRDLERLRSIIANSSSHSLAEIATASDKFEAAHPFTGVNGAYLIAEIGGNHEGDFQYAKTLVQAACKTEVDAVKLQIYSPDLLVNRKLDPGRWEHFKRFSLTADQYKELFEIIHKAGKHTCASVWSLEELEIHEAHIDILKVGSGDLNNAPMLRALATLGKPLVVSTGLATNRQINFACKTILETGFPPEMLSVLQCTSMYPIPQIEANLAVMDGLKDQLGCIIGYSDHTVGYETLLDSISAGARVLEFHFSDNTSNANFRDHLVSLDEANIAEFVVKMRERMARLGSPGKHLTLLERSRNHDVSFRKGLFVRRDITKGHVIEADDLITLRPLEGIDASDYYELIGKTALCDIGELDALSWHMFSETKNT